MRSPYTSAEQAEVAGLRASGLTHRQISERTGYPRRSVTKMLSRVPIIQVVEQATRRQVADALWSTVSQAALGSAEAIAELRAIVRDPKAPAAAKVRAAEGLAKVLSVTAEQHSLLTGQATSRTESTVDTRQPSLTYEQTRNLHQWLDSIVNASDEEITASEEDLTDQIRRLESGARAMEHAIEAGEVDVNDTAGLVRVAEGFLEEVD
jgi:hypothetical protein